ncbi:MAG TPA: VWA domain-containing protein [Planctomycetaceae bacterium]|nr:VWA domain-containing protein [Planctomycetaceae bacterium]
MTLIRFSKLNVNQSRLSDLSRSWREILSAWWTARRVSTASSLLAHMAIVCVLGAIVIAGNATENAPQLEMIFAEEEEDGGGLDFGDVEIELELPPASANLTDSLVSTVAVPMTVMPESSVTLAATLPNVQAPVTEKGGGAKRGTGSNEGKYGAAAGVGTGTADRNGKVSFFGKEVPANSIGFVIDASGSMSGVRFQRARQELMNALSNLKPEQRFFVAFYTDRTFPMFFPDNTLELISADQRNLGRVFNWISQSQSQGGTKPQGAMAMTLRLKPDVIFFLSDGDIPLETQGIVLRYNQGSVIHTIAFGSDIGATLMQQIAEKSGGQYRFIPDGF